MFTISKINFRPFNVDTGITFLCNDYIIVRILILMLARLADLINFYTTIFTLI